MTPFNSHLSKFKKTQADKQKNPLFTSKVYGGVEDLQN